MNDDVFRNPSMSSNSSSSRRQFTRPAAQRSTQLQRNLAHNSNYSMNHHPNISTNADSSSVSSKAAKSEPDLLDAKYTEFRRPWYTNPEYKGPRRQPYYSAVSPQGSLHNVNSYNTQTLPRKIASSNVSPQYYDYSDDNPSNYSNIYRRPRQKNPLRNQSSITTSEPFDDDDAQNRSAFHSFENLMNSRGPISGYSEENLLGTNSGTNPMSSFRLSSSPESAFSTHNSSTGSSNQGGGKELLSSHRRNETIKPRRIRPGGSRTNSNSFSPLSPLDMTDQLQLQPEEVIRPVYSPRNNMTIPMSKNHLEVQQNNLRASSLPRSEFSDIDEIPRRSVGSDGVGSGKSSVSSYKYGDSTSSTGGISNLPISPLGHSQQHPHLIDERVIRRFQHRPSIQSLGGSSSINDDSISFNSTMTRRPIPGSQQSKNEALFHVFSLLDTRSLARCGAVCRIWNSISRESVLWQRIRLRDAIISPQTLIQMTKWCTMVKEVSLQRIRTSTPVENSPDNSELNKIEDSLEKIFHLNKETLKVVRIVDCGDVITNRVMWAASIHLSKLTKLVYLSKNHPLSQADLFPLGRGCSRITSLIVPPGWPCGKADSFNDTCCDTIGRCWTNLHILCIGGRTITSVGLTHIARNCIKLQHLELDHGPEVTEDTASRMIALGLRGLQKLDFTFTPVSPRAVVLFSNACPRLDHIGIHCSITDYFSNPSSSKAKADYNSLKTLFRRLKSRTAFTKVLDIDLDYEVTS